MLGLANFCILLVEMGFRHVGQAGLKHLTSSDPPTLAFRSAGITGMSNHTWPMASFLTPHEPVSAGFKLSFWSFSPLSAFTELKRVKRLAVD